MDHSKCNSQNGYCPECLANYELARFETIYKPKRKPHQNNIRGSGI